jgi:hypothetical protein
MPCIVKLHDICKWILLVINCTSQYIFVLPFSYSSHYWKDDGSMKCECVYVCLSHTLKIFLLKYVNVLHCQSLLYHHNMTTAATVIVVIIARNHLWIKPKCLEKTVLLDISVSPIIIQNPSWHWGWGLIPSLKHCRLHLQSSSDRIANNATLKHTASSCVLL